MQASRNDCDSVTVRHRVLAAAASVVLALALSGMPGGTAAAQQAKPAAKPAAAPATPPTMGGATPSLLGQFGDWGAYTASPGGKKVCFALAKPGTSTTSPPNRPRDPTYVFVSTRPAEKVKDEISVIIGYGFKPGSEASLAAGGASYGMYTQNESAWVKNPADEAKLIDSLRKAADMVVKGVSGRGTASTDTYSLKGLAQALDRVAQECR